MEKVIIKTIILAFVFFAIVISVTSINEIKRIDKPNCDDYFFSHSKFK